MALSGPSSLLFPALNHHGCHQLPASTREAWVPAFLPLAPGAPAKIFSLPTETTL